MSGKLSLGQARAKHGRRPTASHAVYIFLKEEDIKYGG